MDAVPESAETSSSAPSLRAINAEARRRCILDAARELIARGGIEALSMRKLATQAEVAVTTLYNLYGGRGEILLAIINEAADSIIMALDAESTLDDPIERCFSIIQVTVRECGRNESTHRPMMVAGFGPQSLQVDSDRRIAGRAIALQCEALEAARDRRLLRPEADAMRLAEQIFHGYDLACAQWAHGRIDLAAFEARSLYGLVLALQALASDELQPTLEARRIELEQCLADAS